MKTRRITSPMILLVALAVPGCASIVTGTKQTVDFQTHPPGARATVNGQQFTTPGSLTLKRKKTYDVVFEKPGYVTTSRHIGHHTNGWFWGNIIIGGMIGVCIDAGTGAMYSLDPKLVSVRLVEDIASGAAAPPEETMSLPPEGESAVPKNPAASP